MENQEEKNQQQLNPNMALSLETEPWEHCLEASAITTALSLLPRNKSAMIERFSNECRQTKTKVITLTNQKGRRQSSRPIKTLSNYT